MPVAAAPTPTAQAPAGLSENTQKLWLSAQRYRRLADLAGSKAGR